MIRPEDATSEALRKCSSYRAGNGNHVAFKGPISSII
jgi:hypothetical protein